jgi:hypothetical protein
MIRIVVDLPAPLGPSNPKDSPLATSKSMASTAVKSPNFLVNPRALMSDSGIDLSYRLTQVYSSTTCGYYINQITISPTTMFL